MFALCSDFAVFYSLVCLHSFAKPAMARESCLSLVTINHDANVAGVHGEV